MLVAMKTCNKQFLTKFSLNWPIQKRKCLPFCITLKALANCDTALQRLTLAAWHNWCSTTTQDPSTLLKYLHVKYTEILFTIYPAFPHASAETSSSPWLAEATSNSSPPDKIHWLCTLQERIEDARYIYLHLNHSLSRAFIHDIAPNFWAGFADCTCH